MSNAPRDARARRDWGTDDSATDILHVDMDSFFAQVEMLEDPSLRGHPLIVGGVGPRGVVTSATYEARGAGVRAGMPTLRARALCPEALVVGSTPGVYAHYSRRVMDLLDGITPLLEQISVDEAFLDVSGSRLRLGSPTSIGHELRRRIREEIGLPASVGIAATKSVAKIASSHAKPDGLLLVPAASTTDFLHGLPVGALWGVGGRTQEVLTREGIDTIGDLAHTPVHRLERLVGRASAHQLHDLSWGVDRRRVSPGREEKSVGTETTFARDVVDRTVLERFVLDASHRCARRLRNAGLVAHTVVLKLRGADFRTVTRSRTLSAPTDTGRDIARVAGELLAGEPVPPGGVRLLGVRAENLARRSEGVEVPLDEDARPGRTERAMDRVAERFGDGALRPASLLERRTPRVSGDSPGTLE